MTDESISCFENKQILQCDLVTHVKISRQLNNMIVRFYNEQMSTKLLFRLNKNNKYVNSLLKIFNSLTRHLTMRRTEFDCIVMSDVDFFGNEKTLT